ncbi:MAG: 5'/3'-nucleotidase SurE [Candidatus Bipolaricaulota bacterium]|nr:5'/3'-nucleotidase SurE [Candidatus Bipolaricaulota bacterium]MCX7844314.1 5'/3'-nucleotidase SurE [Candidatus Bipolaricaulota bacterium]MDW8152548.1 5'/3'-nucleotidase SurE [Candidatus Bipolaricaulota bacterium]
MAPLILLTNDDGYLSPGLHALRRALSALGEVWVLAPEKNWSAASRTRVFHKPLRVYAARLPDGETVRVTNGSPSDCVLLGLLGLAPRRPDLVVAGINQGANLGRDVTYSGTVSAAMEGAQHGIPSLAVSLDVSGEPEESPDYETAAQVAVRLARVLLENPLPQGILLNVNVPRGTPRGLRVTRLGGKIWSEELVRGTDPRGREFFWFAGEMLAQPPAGEEDTDVWAVLSGYVSVTPLHLDLTAYEMLEALRCLERLHL